jgi:hypothetical protein
MHRFLIQCKMQSKSIISLDPNVSKWRVNCRIYLENVYSIAPCGLYYKTITIVI